MSSAEIGVVVIGRNEGERLVTCLKSMLSQIENTVYVDSGSTDESVENARKLGAVVHELDMSKPFTAARARNAGFAELRKLRRDLKYIQFIDGDCEINQDWIPAAAEFLDAHADVAVVCGRRRERFPERSIYNRLCDTEWATPVGEAKACGGDFLVRTEAFQQVDGFRDDLIAGEEPEFCVRLRDANWRIWRIDAEMTLHDAAMTRFGQWWKRAVRGGFGSIDVWLRHRLSPNGIYGRATLSALAWGAALPILIVVASLFEPLFLLGFLAYPAQISRIALRRAGSSGDAWPFAFFVVVGKFAECAGIARFIWLKSRGGTARLIEYK